MLPTKLLNNVHLISLEEITFNMHYGYPIRHDKLQGHNAYNWRAISVPPERFGSSYYLEKELYENGTEVMGLLIGISSSHKSAKLNCFGIVGLLVAADRPGWNVTV